MCACGGACAVVRVRVKGSRRAHPEFVLTHELGELAGRLAYSFSVVEVNNPDDGLNPLRRGKMRKKQPLPSLCPFLGMPIR